MPQTRKIDVFDPSHFPTGSAVRIHTDDSCFDAIILRYEEMFTRMVVLTTGLIAKIPYVKTISTDGNCMRLEVTALNRDYRLERLVPESEEEEDLDYAALMTEHEGLQIYPPDSECFVTHEGGADNED